MNDQKIQLYRPDMEQEIPDASADAADSNSVPPALTQYWQIAVRWRWAIAGIILGALAVGVVWTLLTPLSYTATALIEISREKKNITNVEGIDSAEEGRDLEFYDTQYALLEANSLAERVARRLNLARNNDFFAAHGKKLDAEKLGLGGRTPLTKDQLAEREKLAVQTLLKSVSISPVRKSRLVDVSYASRSPQLSATIANTWSQEFINATMDRQFASSADARTFLEQRLATLRTRLEESERDAANYASQKNIVELSTVRDASGRSQTGTLAAANLEALNTALSEAIADRIRAESRSAASGADASPEALASPALADMRRRRAELAAESARLLVQFEPGYPAVEAVRQQIKALDASIAREVARVSGGRSQTYQEALRREQELRAKVDEYKRQLDIQSRDSIQYNIFRRDADTNRQLYDALLQRYKEIGVAGVVGSNNIAIIDQAKVPEWPSAPSLSRNLAIMLLVGLVLAGGTALALEQIDEGVRDPNQVTKLFAVPLLGQVPETTTDAMEGLSDAKSYISESYFSVRSSLAFSTTHGLPRSFMITSTRPAEGKSTSALALAVVIGRTGKRVLLVDGDMRSPSVHEIVGGTNEAGLSNLLVGSDDFRRMIRETAYRGVSVLPAGPMPPSAAELLSSDRLTDLLATLLHEFDHLIVDSPPVLGLTDAPLIGRAVEGCVYVIQAESAPVRGIRGSLERLHMANVHVFGAVVTKLKQRRTGYGYGYGYGYGDNIEGKSG
jgi:polysaccharide biosynthesis transport protein